jgi:hypothetical protein
MGFNRREMEGKRKAAAEKEAAARRALDPQILEDAERLVAAWNERQAGRMPSLFSPTIGAITAQHYFLWVRCPACRTTSSVDLRTLDWHRDGQLSSRRCRIDLADRTHPSQNCCGCRRRVRTTCTPSSAATGGLVSPHD